MRQGQFAKVTRESAAAAPVSHHVREAFDEMCEEALADGGVVFDPPEPEREVQVRVQLGHDD